jgi:hypothetical protein
MQAPVQTPAQQLWAVQPTEQEMGRLALQRLLTQQV